MGLNLNFLGKKINDILGGVGQAIGTAADFVVPGDQSNWHQPVNNPAPPVNQPNNQPQVNLRQNTYNPLPLKPTVSFQPLSPMKKIDMYGNAIDEGIENKLKPTDVFTTPNKVTFKQAPLVKLDPQTLTAARPDPALQSASNIMSELGYSKEAISKPTTIDTPQVNMPLETVGQAITGTIKDAADFGSLLIEGGRRAGEGMTDSLRAMPRAVAALTLQATGEKETLPGQYTPVNRILLGSEPIKNSTDQYRDLVNMVPGEYGTKTPGGLATALGVGLSASDLFLGGAGKKAGTKGVGEVLKTLAKETNVSNIRTTLNGVEGLSPQSVDNIAANIARTDDKKLIENVIRNEIQNPPPIVKQGNNLGLDVNTLQQRAANYNNLDDAAKQTLVQNAKTQLNEGISPNVNTWSKGAVYNDLLSAGLAKDDIANISKTYGLDATGWRTALNRAGDMSKAKNPAGVLVSHIKEINGVKPKVALKQDVVPTKIDAVTGEVFDAPTVKNVAGPIDELAQYGIDLKAQTTKVQKEFDNIYADIEKQGYDVYDLGRKQVMTERGDYTPTPKELEQMNSITNRLNEAFEKSGLQLDGYRGFYRPQTKAGKGKLPTTREELMDIGFTKQRKNSYGVDEIDYSTQPLVDYVLKAENRPLLLKASIVDAAATDGRTITKEGVESAAAKTEALQKKVHDASKSAKVLNNDTATDLFSIGKDEGYIQAINTYRPGSLVQESKTMLERAGIWENGFKQYDNATGYASEFARQMGDNKVPLGQVPDAIVTAIQKSMPNIDKSTLSGISRYVAKSLDENTLAPEQAIGIYQNAFKNAAKAEMFRLGKTTAFADNKMRKVVNEQINGRILASAYQKSLSGKFNTFLAQRINVSLRGLNFISAAFETGDYANIGTKYGYSNLAKSGLGVTPIGGDTLQFSHKYGQTGAHYLSGDIPQVKKLDDIWRGDGNWVQKLGRSYQNAEDKLLIFRYVEQHKTEVFFRAADKHYRKAGLEGQALVDAVMNDYYTTMLPHTLATSNRLIGKMPSSLTQYLDWSMQATKRLGRTVSGSDEGGKLANRPRIERIARGFGGEIAPKIIAGMVVGVPIMQIMGMRDWTGVTTGDFSGIPEEDKNNVDTLVGLLSLSPALGAAANYYFADRRNDIAAQNKADGETYNTEPRPEDTISGVTKKNAEMLIPFKTQINKMKQVLDATPVDVPDINLPKVNIAGIELGGNITGENKGYYESRDGRVQLEAPTGIKNLAIDMIRGKTYSDKYREYQDVPNISSIAKGDTSPLDLLLKNKSVSNAIQFVTGESTNNYQRPLTKDYSEAYKKADEVSRTALMDGGRQYNKTLDDLKRNNRDAYNNYIRSMDGNHVNPERWREILGSSASGDMDLAAFNMIADRKKQLKSDMDKANENNDGKYNYDPLYDLPEKQARSVLQLKATPTGADLAIRNILFKEDWYKDFYAKQKDFYNKMPEFDGDTKTSDRVKEWNTLSDSYNELTGATGTTLNDKYPLVAQLKKYEYGSDASKQFLKNNWDAWNAQNNALEEERLAVINKMRSIEGQDPMSMVAYQQATEVAKTDSKSTSSGYSNGYSNGYTRYARSSSGSSGGSTPDVVNPSKYAISTKASIGIKAAAAPKVAAKITSKRVSTAKGKPKVALKKSKV